MGERMNEFDISDEEFKKAMEESMDDFVLPGAKPLTKRESFIFCAGFKRGFEFYLT